MTASAMGAGQRSENPPAIRVLGQTPKLQLPTAEALFLELGKVGLDPSRVYRARGVSLDRAAIHITLEDGVLGFTEDVAGRVTGAFFAGEGEILLAPPNPIERASMMFQTGAAILEERFSSAYFRFNDDTFAALKPALSASENAQEFVNQWGEGARLLASTDALRIFMTFSRFLPVARESPASPAVRAENPSPDDRFLHVRMQGETKGRFEVYFDSNLPEQVWAAQLRTVNGLPYYDVWTSFALQPKSKAQAPWSDVASEEGRTSTLVVSASKVRAVITPPTRIEAEAVLDLEVRRGGLRAVLFELARTLVIKQVDADGEPLEFIHNPAIEGSERSRRGNDLVAVVFREPTRTGQRIKLHFVYGGDVLSEAGPGLLYVGARGTWYPNRGAVMSNFDLEFHYPPGWTLVATGKRVDTGENTAAKSGPGAGEQVSRWISERPIPLAGFNLGKYRQVVARAGPVTVAAFGTGGVERGFPRAESEIVLPPPPGTIGEVMPSVVIASEEPSPAQNGQMVAAMAVRAVEFFALRFGPYPYGELALTQMPGTLSQGWPGLIFLSSLSFLNPQEQAELHIAAVDKVLINSVIAHETAHQWWGDLVIWSDYRDQWISEGLANYSALMLLEAADPGEFHAVMAKYRDDLLDKNKAGVPLMEDGPVTLGLRLSDSQFPQGYVAISYGRGTWLFHMLRTLMRDGELRDRHRGGRVDVNEPFVRAVRRARERYEGKAMTTRELLQAFEEELPPSAWYEGHRSLDWFYQTWINGTAIPRFELHGMKYTDQEATATVVKGVISQKDAPKDLVTPVPLYALRGSKLVWLGRVFADGPETPFLMQAPAGTRKIVVDPDQTLLARVH
ncbi:MAG TPA: M1 family aminopeptidase [Terriglobales bacterium]|nr:M1 family aminopeptidase [Terriglobales bacterium]